jgi:hypothetical protein
MGEEATQYAVLFSFLNSLSAPDISFNTPFSNIHSLCYSLNITNHVSHPYTTTGTVSLGMTTDCDI